MNDAWLHSARFSAILMSRTPARIFWRHDVQIMGGKVCQCEQERYLRAALRSLVRIAADIKGCDRGNLPAIPGLAASAVTVFPLIRIDIK